MRSSFDRAYRRCRPVTLWIDRFLKPRLTFLLRPPLPRLMAAFCTLLALTMIPLELLPFAAALPALTIALLAMGLSGNDGLWLLLGMAVFAGGAAGLSFYVPWF
ncbi:exopolysaccharide biosynthesis protein [Marinobacteraceae bacterium S3BR75-40.1]